ncbi:TcaA 3rd/4th domain-containing protein [Rossellomorea oryzaecorticis]|uniref:TcaA 3rd/4th domain-containing protein n=1 Tax=Rossellomorea oryzaecorticis TaxID=1396505 RepID=A0ABW8VLQ4_9BACI
MKFCKQCGQALSEGKLFCSHCGKAAAPSETDKNCGNLMEGDECSTCSVNDSFEVESRFCKMCGEALNGDEECQRCAVPSKRYCKNCGTALSQFESYCADCRVPVVSQPEKPESPPTRHKKKPRPLMISLIIFAILLAGSATYGYFYVKDASHPSHTTDILIEALEKKDAPTLQGLLSEASDIPLTRDALQDFLEQLHSDSEIYDELLENIKMQEKTIVSAAPNDPFLIQLKKSPEKKWLFIDQYTAALIPVSFTLDTDPDAKVFLNDKEVPASGKESRVIENVMPGEFTFKAIKDGEWRELETSMSLFIWKDSDVPIPLLFDEQYITVTSEFEGAEVYLDGEPYGTIEDSSLQIGPVSEGDSVVVSGKYSYPWEHVYSKEATASASETIELEFPIASSQVLKDDLTSDIINYNTSYIESITRVDSSVLRNVKGKQLEDNIKTVKNLEKRSITYGGYLKDMIFDEQSLDVQEENGTYKASIDVEELYASSWNDPADPDAAETILKAYHYTYYCEYDEEAGEWIVYDSEEH